MVKSASDIVSEMVDALRVADPELDTSIGSVARKILDVVSEQIAPAYAVSHITDYVYEVESKQGGDLDDFCTLFGIYRFPAKRAVGIASFSRPSLATENVTIPRGTQISTGTIPRVVFATVASAVMVKGTKLVSVPVQAVIAGESGNLPAKSLTNLVTPISGVSATTKQSDACVGGINAESDESMRNRFKKTIFRSLAGTEDMFMGVALEDTTLNDASDAVAVQANVIGASKRWREQVQVVFDDPDYVAVSTIPAASAKFVYSGSEVFGPDIDNGEILTEGIHYDWDTTVNPPRVVSIDGNLEASTVYDLDFEYVPEASRNEPDDGITNRVDIWVSGVAPQQASETTYWQPDTFNTTPASPFYVNRYIRQDEPVTSVPENGNLFLQLAWGPIVEFPNQITIAGTTYDKGTDFWVVHDDTGYGYSPVSKFGLEFAAATHPDPNDQIVLSDASAYFYNRLPHDVEARARKWRLVTTDVRAHAAKQVRLRCNFAIMYDPAYDPGTVQASVETTLANWMTNLGFRAILQVSDLLQVAHSVPGVDNIRLLNESEPAVSTNVNSWGIEKVTSNGTRISNYDSGGSPGRAIDIVLAENEVPVFYAARFATKAQNTYGEPG